MKTLYKVLPKSLYHRNMNSIEGATLFTMQQPKHIQKKEDIL